MEGGGCSGQREQIRPLKTMTPKEQGKPVEEVTAVSATARDFHVVSAEHCSEEVQEKEIL